MRPDPEVNNAVIYCLGYAAQKYNVDVLNFTHMSNHLHEEIFDRDGTAPDFYHSFHGLLAKCINAKRGRWENFFSNTQTSVVTLETREALIDKLVYIATNPILDNLVERVDDWPGASGYRALLSGEPLRATRPKFFFAEDGDMPEEVTLQLTIPPELGDREEILAEVKARVEAVEQEQAVLRQQTGRRVVGRASILRRHWNDSPTSREPRRQMNPTIAARCKWALMEALQRKRDFIVSYRNALAALIRGERAVFPYGTYWLKRFAGVVIAAPQILI